MSAEEKLIVENPGPGFSRQRSTLFPQMTADWELPATPEEWMDDALCAQTDPEAFFPEKGGSTREAKKICASCEVRAACLDYALRSGASDGIWGGLSPRERRRLADRPAPGRRADADRDAEIARLTGAGWSAVEIARHLGVAERTVRRARRRAA